jgi:hypothetical protein
MTPPTGAKRAKIHQSIRGVLELLWLPIHQDIILPPFIKLPDPSPCTKKFETGFFKAPLIIILIERGGNYSQTSWASLHLASLAPGWHQRHRGTMFQCAASHWAQCAHHRHVGTRWLVSGPGNIECLCSLFRGKLHRPKERKTGARLPV